MVFLCLTLLFHKLFQGIIALTDPDVFFLGILSEKFSKCAGLITEIPFVCEIKDFIKFSFMIHKAFAKSHKFKAPFIFYGQQMGLKQPL